MKPHKTKQNKTKTKQPAATQSSQLKSLFVQAVAEELPLHAQVLVLVDESPHPGGQFGAVTGSGVVDERKQSSLKVCLSASLTQPMDLQ